ncbi:hypothetical protein ACOSQ3_016752 [Xanthoceras sorbifolium]
MLIMSVPAPPSTCQPFLNSFRIPLMLFCLYVEDLKLTGNDARDNKKNRRSKTRSTCCEERRGAEEAFENGYNCKWRCFA